MTKEERQDRRESNRSKRQERRTDRQEKFREFLERVENAPEISGETLVFKQDFNTFWPVIRAAIEYVEVTRFTGKKLDKKLNAIIDLGDDISEGHDADSEFRDKLLELWRVVRLILIGVAVFVKDENADEALDKAIEIGDWLSGFEDSE